MPEIVDGALTDAGDGGEEGAGQLTEDGEHVRGPRVGTDVPVDSLDFVETVDVFAGPGPSPVTCSKRPCGAAPSAAKDTLLAHQGLSAPTQALERGI